MTELTNEVGRLTIDLAAIQSNWQLIQDKTGADVEVSAVVKADAYGLGVDKVAPALYLQGCRHFYVANLTEGEELRGLVASDAQIFLLAGVPSGKEAECARLSLTPVLSSLSAIRSWSKLNKQSGDIFPSIIKFDTGMTRLGLSIDELSELLSVPEELALAGVKGFMSHLACADEVVNPLNAQQLKIFVQMSKEIKRHFPDASLSLANSSATFISSDYYFDRVRPGAALYGINPAVSSPNLMSDVVSLSLPILQLKTLKEASSVGYGMSGQSSSGSVLAVVQGGYADGLHRTLGCDRTVYLGCVEVPVVGRISMDTTILDVSALENVAAGDFVEVMGKHRSLESLRESSSSLGYEVLTGLGPRYQRIYLGGQRYEL